MPTFQHLVPNPDLKSYTLVNNNYSTQTEINFHRYNFKHLNLQNCNIPNMTPFISKKKIKSPLHYDAYTSHLHTIRFDRRNCIVQKSYSTPNLGSKTHILHGSIGVQFLLRSTPDVTINYNLHATVYQTSHNQTI